MNARMDHLAIINKYTKDDSKVFVIDQTDSDGIMAMWYARYYSFPRKINAASNAITWKILTKSNTDDLQDWGLNAQTFKEELYKYGFDYVFLYSSTDEYFEVTKDYYDNFEKAKKSTLFSVAFDGDRLNLIPIE